MIELRGVSYVYSTATRPTLDDVNLSIREGEWLLLAGPSGCGKSTLLYLLNGLIPHVVAGELQGEVRVDGLVPGGVPLAAVSRRVGTVFQNPEVQLFMLRVAEDVAFGCENLGLPPAETLRRVDRALGQMSLTALRDHETFRLSGGQKQRLAIAGALAMGSRTLLLDEPTSDLDRGSRSELLAALQELHHAGHTIVMTEHRFDGLQGLVDRVITLADGCIVSDGPFPEIVAPARSSKEPIAGNGAIAECEHLAFSYPCSTPVLGDVSFELQAGDVVALTGCNGTGKTTLLKLLCGLLQPNGGQLTIAGQSRPSVQDLVGIVGFLFQNPDEQLFTESVATEIEFGPTNLGRPVAIDSLLERIGLSQHRVAHPRSLSRGQRQLLAAASVLAMKPRLLLLDEPTTGLDQSAWTRLMQLVVEQAHEDGTCVLFSTHHNEVVEAFASRQFRLGEGRLTDARLP
ncbi:MAG: energy-coupling factor ABC transporter ATP-binding protein [Pirellulaceae bacterium]|jgi:energy-coupling factor transporter ATP-binding protein EcfA2|nr:energy-coupling factor ABC transporter ATP-binding protein [Pirellulaceae bacterium]